VNNLSGLNITSISHDKVTTVHSAISETIDTVASLTAVNCSGFNKLYVAYTCTTGWDRAGTIKIYGSIDNTNYVLADATVENASFGVLHTDDAGEYYIVENIPPSVKVGFDCTTAGTTGTITVKIMPFNG
jgi:hypothetical protein